MNYSQRKYNEGQSARNDIKSIPFDGIQIRKEETWEAN